MSRKIGQYLFPTPMCLLDAKPPKGQAGVYALLIKTSKDSKGTVRYIGSTSDLQSRINWGHNKAKELLNEVDRDPSRILVTWIVIPSKSQYHEIEAKLIKHFGTRTCNVETKAK